MAKFIFAISISIAAFVAGESFGDRQTVMQTAREWLRTHQDPGDEAGMAELKSTNPDAYAVVQALLTKKSLGLLNSRHPTASMNPADGADAEVDSPQAAPKAPEMAEPNVDVQVPSAPAHHDFLNWKPASDDQMVSNVLGMVAGLKGGIASQGREVTASAVENVQVQQPQAQPQIEAVSAQPPAEVQSQLPQQQPQHHASALSFDWGNTYAGIPPKNSDTRIASAAPVMKAPAQQAPAQQAEIPASDASVEVEVPSATMPHDFLHWKPQSDEQMVSNVLGMVAGLTHRNVPQPAATPEEDAQAPPVEANPIRPFHFQSDEQPRPQPVAQMQPQPQKQSQHHASALSFDWGNTYAGFEPKSNNFHSASASPVMKTPAQQDSNNNPYLKGIDFSSELNPSTMSQVTENSYLKSVDFDAGVSAPKPKAAITAKDIGGPNKLTAFNWYN